MSDTPIRRLSRVLTYPIYILPGRRFPRIDVRETIARSELPFAAQQLIADVVRRTRLWQGEKGEVVLELIAHFRDGVEAGPSADELISNFGSIKTAAQLIRRGKRRNRPLWWHARRRFLQAVGAVLLVYIGLALLLVVRHPNPTVDYVAEWNRPVLATPPADRAWPIYRYAWTRAQIWKLDDAPLRPEGRNVTRWFRPGDAQWPEAVVFLRQHKPLLDAAREAGLKPALGWELNMGSFAAMAPEDRAAFGPSAASSPVAGPYGNDRVERLLLKCIVSINLPYLSPMRVTANLLAADMRLAASEGDADRVLADYRALVGMARQLSEMPILINELVGLNIAALADRTLMEINQSMPQSLTGCRIDLLHVMAAATGSLRTNVSSERLFFLDILQRVYSDNGHGDGSPTLDGLQLLTVIRRPMLDSRHQPEPPEGELARVLAMPTAVVAMASRKEMTEQVERLYAIGERDAARPLWVKLHSPGSADTLLAEWHQSLAKQIRYPLLAMLPYSITWRPRA